MFGGRHSVLCTKCRAICWSIIKYFLFKDVHNGNGICDSVDGADGVDDPHQHGDPVNSEPMNGDASNGHGEYDENSSGIFDFILIFGPGFLRM